MFAKVKVLLIPACFFIAITMPSIASSDLLWPFKVGYTYKYIEGDDSFEYDFVTERLTIDSLDYFHMINFDTEAPYPEQWEDEGFYRSTEDAIFYKNKPDEADILGFRAGPPGTTWYRYEEVEGEYKYFVYKIVDVNAYVSVPYGDFSGAYECLESRCKDAEGEECLPQTESFWIVPGVGHVKQVGVYDTEELFDIIPPRISYFFVPHCRFEDGSEFNLLLFGFRGGDDPDEGLNFYNPVPVEEFNLFDPDASITLYDSNSDKVVLSDERIDPLNVAYGNYDGSAGSYSGEFRYESGISAKVNELLTGTYTLEVTDVNGNTYEANWTYNVVDLPFIRAATFETDFDGDGNFIWQWTADASPEMPHNTSLRAFIRLFNGETYTGLHWITVPSTVDHLSIPTSFLSLDNSNRFKLQIQIRTNDNSNRTYSNMISVPLQDADQDGISDVIDKSGEIDTSEDPSNDFNDGQTSGTITNRGDQVLAITDAEKSEEGVLLAASGGTEQAIVETCSGGGQVSLDAGDEVVVTCGSVKAKVISGTVDIAFRATDGTVANTSMNAGNGIEFDPDTFTFTAPESNPDPVIVVVDGVEVPVVPGQETMVAGIDIKPLWHHNIIILSKWGLIPVAILSSENFDAPIDVERTSITFGQTGNEDSLAFCRRCTKDVNGDGLRDVICIFWTRDTGFQVGDTMGILKCVTEDGMHIQGSDSVVIVGHQRIW
jgi:hypothetical protein